jgi:hypothetical protein
MADERYEWLDKKAAERLLRGEPVEAADEHARSQAARLSGALCRAGRPTCEDDGEMPGEAAAMAAFRKVRADSAAPAGDTLTGVRRTRSVRRPKRGPRFGRPVRFGFAAAVAGCALGGVAVATGTGVLPTPFGGGGGPLPAASVSAAATPGPLTSQSPADGGAHAPSHTPGGTGTPPVSPSATAGSGEPGMSGGSTTGEPSGSGTGTGAPDGSTDSQNSELYRKSVEACRDYRAGRIDPEHKRRLEAAAKGPERVEPFCDRLLGDGGSGDSDGSGGDGESDKGDGGKDDGGSGDGTTGDAPLPPVSWVPAPDATSPSAPAPSPGIDSYPS